MLDLDIDCEDSFIEKNEIDINEFNKNISNISSTKLCDIIITYKYVGFNKELAVLCMEELSNRRQNGDVFEFESYIDNEFSKLPELDFSMIDFNSAIKQIGEQFLK